MEELATEANSKDLWFYLLQIWSSIVVGVIVYLGGVSTKRVVHIWVPKDAPDEKQPLWYKLWAATLAWHPVAVGGLLGLVPWPSPDFLHHWWVRVLWFAGVGAVCGQIYRIVSTVSDGLPALVRQIFAAVIEWVRGKMGLAPAPAPAAPKADSVPPPDDSPPDATGDKP